MAFEGVATRSARASDARASDARAPSGCLDQLHLSWRFVDHIRRCTRRLACRGPSRAECPLPRAVLHLSLLCSSERLCPCHSAALGTKARELGRWCTLPRSDRYHCQKAIFEDCARDSQVAINLNQQGYRDYLKVPRECLASVFSADPSFGAGMS